MKKVKVKLTTLRKKPTVSIDRAWFPYREIVNGERYERICWAMERYIQECRLKNGAVYYDIVELDKNGNPLEIVISYTTKRFLNETEHISVLPTKFNPKYSDN